MPALTVSNLSISYDDKTVIDNFSYTFEEGGHYAILGVSGIGKTTLLNRLCEMLLDLGQKVSYMFQDNLLLENASIAKNIKLVNPQLCEKDISDSLQKTGLSVDLSTCVSKLSGGMKRRVALIRAMLYESDIVILDEPFSGLDEASRLAVSDYINSSLNGRTLIVSTHFEQQIEAFHCNVLHL